MHSRAENRAGLFDAANKLYEQGKFTEAVAAYEKLAQSGRTSAAVYFNLGNACFKAGQIGRAILAYRQAAQLTPRDPDLRANLQFARNQTAGPTLAPDRWQRWLSRLTLNEWTFLAAGAVWLWLLLLALLQWQPAWKTTLRGWSAILAIVAGLSCAGLGGAWYATQHARTAVVITRDAVAHNGPLEDAKSLFTAHDGAELRVLDQRDEWLQVSAGPGWLGWVRREQVVLPP